MRFNVKCVRECLEKHGMVFTVRRWRSRQENSIVHVPGIGTCLKQRVREIKSPDDLKNTVRLSGFDSLEEWVKQIESFGAMPGWLYFVKIIEREGSDKCSKCSAYATCKLRTQGFSDLCDAPRNEGVRIGDKVVYVKRKPSEDDSYEPEWRSMGYTYNPYSGEEFTPAELYSATPVMMPGPLPEVSHPLDYLDDPVITTKSEIKRRRERYEAKRRERFMENHGYRIKYKLKTLLESDPTKAKRVASRLTLEDWKALSMVGGLR